MLKIRVGESLNGKRQFAIWRTKLTNQTIYSFGFGYKVLIITKENF